MSKESLRQTVQNSIAKIREIAGDALLVMENIGNAEIDRAIAQSDAPLVVQKMLCDKIAQLEQQVKNLTEDNEKSVGQINELCGIRQDYDEAVAIIQLVREERDGLKSQAEKLKRDNSYLCAEINKLYEERSKLKARGLKLRSTLAELRKWTTESSSTDEAIADALNEYDKA